MTFLGDEVEVERMEHNGEYSYALRFVDRKGVIYMDAHAYQRLHGGDWYTPQLDTVSRHEKLEEILQLAKQHNSVKSELEEIRHRYDKAREGYADKYGVVLPDVL